MILYFSGTGNSEYVAKRIGKETKEEVINLFERIKNHDFSKMNSESTWVIVAPTYAWRIPRILCEWLEQATLSGSREIYFVMTCGGEVGNAGKYLEKLCALKKMDYLGCFPIVMPENYIAMFSVPEKEEALEIIGQAEAEIDKAVFLIKNGERFPKRSVTLKDKMSSGIVNDMFYPICVHAKKFYVDDTCISCGKCVNVCPLNNIRMENGKPVWERIVHIAWLCICRCPKEAIEYGGQSKGKARYICPK